MVTVEMVNLSLKAAFEVRFEYIFIRTISGNRA